MFFRLTLIPLIILFVLVSTIEAADVFPLNWQYRAQITIDAGQVTGISHDNFPIIIRETDLPPELFNGDLPSLSPTAGDDIRFSLDPAGATELDFELVQFDDATVGTQIWVKINTLPNAGISLYVWWGNADPAGPAPNNVWVNYHAVWHLEENALPYLDSTGNDYHADAGNTPDRVSGATASFGYAQSFDRGNSDKLTCSTGINLSTGSDFSLQGRVSAINLNTNTNYMWLAKGFGGGGGNKVWQARARRNGNGANVYDPRIQGQNTIDWSAGGDPVYDGSNGSFTYNVSNDEAVLVHNGTEYIDNNPTFNTK
ncbi:MAG: hypothetical protein HRU15_10355, partial [Planctomycetes bacterium]|nr:hypothetical protein [Planctomycetota bacterium]